MQYDVNGQKFPSSLGSQKITVFARLEALGYFHRPSKYFILLILFGIPNLIGLVWNPPSSVCNQSESGFIKTTAHPSEDMSVERVELEPTTFRL